LASGRLPAKVTSESTANMSNRDIVVIGGSSGALQALEVLLADLAADLPAALFVVLHGGSATHDSLARILRAAGPLPTEPARDGARFQRGCVYTAPKDMHMLVSNGRITLQRGPRENMARPAIDPLFRSAASSYGSRVVGVLLSGMLYDGAAGMRAVARCGGITLVQHPEDALCPDMPRNALEHTEVSHCTAARDLAPLLTRIVAESAGPSPQIPREIAAEVSLSLLSGVPGDADQPLGKLSPLTCPECGGSLSEQEDGALLRYRCHTGHVLDGRHLLMAQLETIEHALWSAVRAHEERATLLRRLAHQARAHNRVSVARRWEELVAEREEEANVIRRLLMNDPTGGSGANTAVADQDDRSGAERSSDGLDQAVG
jgi:two-component system, chemotaxis family, protein-glutamate methylesterase/glutaminase